jgi:Mg-chelatase subunit ChlD
MPGHFLEDLLRSADYASSIDARSWDELRKAFPGSSFERWLDALQEIARLPGAPLLVRRFAATSISLATRIGPDACLAAVPAALASGKRSGPRAVMDFLSALPLIAPEAKDPGAFMIWLRTIEELNSLAPESAAIVVQQSATVLARLSVRGFRSWVFNGIHASSGDAERRQAYFSQTDNHSLAPFERNEGDIIFADVEKPLRAFCRALWNIQPALRSALVLPGVKAVRRSTFDGLFIQVPEVYPGYRGMQAVAHYFAVVAHATAHIAHTRLRFEKGTLRPLQKTLVGLIEDARVEALAIAQYPGLRRLWLQFHNAQPGTAASAELLMMRLSRALLDPAYADDDPWVRKGARMFFDARERWNDPAISREIGNLLGNDLGQMRIQFNPKSYVAEPSYRDDGNGLWEFDEPPPSESDRAETVLESVRISTREENERPDKHEQNDDSTQHANMAASAKPSEEDSGVPIARHPEWDYITGTLRHDWTTVLEFKPRHAPPQQIDAILEQHEETERRIARLVRSAKVSRPRRIRGQTQGDRLDLDACIRASIDRRAGLTPETRVYETSEMLSRDLSVLLLLDVSESTRDRVKDTNTSVLAMERAAAALLAQAMHDLGDPFAIHAFCSNGRSEVRYYRVKDFGEPFTMMTRGALAGLRGMMSTRLGAALRQAGDEIAPQPTHRKLVLVITDGEPSDVDVPDRAYLVEDARRAVQSLSHRGVDVFCVGLESGADSSLPRIFGVRNFLKMTRVEALPERLPMLYFRLTM